MILGKKLYSIGGWGMNGNFSFFFAATIGSLICSQLTLALVVLVGTLLWSQESKACSCAPPFAIEAQDIEQSFGWADIVFVGFVVEFGRDDARKDWAVRKVERQPTETCETKG